MQKVSGTFYLPMGDGFIQTYDNIQNVVVRLSENSKKQNDTEAILVNCHFDSVPQVSNNGFVNHDRNEFFEQHIYVTYIRLGGNSEMLILAF